MDNSKEAVAHCPWSPSYLKQIMDCPMSLAKDGLAIDDGGEAAEHGTIQHALLIKDRLAKRFGLPSEDVDASALSQDEIEEVDRAYAFVIGEYLLLKDRHPRVDVILEEKLDLGRRLPRPCWGYVDIAFIGHRARPNALGVYDKSTIYVIDAKFGRVAVDVRCPDHPDANGFSVNPQLCAYWAGLYSLACRKRYEVTRAMVAIAQPKLGSFPKMRCSPRDLLLYQKHVILPKVIEAINGTGHYAPSVTACRFCRNKIHCKHNNAQIIAFNALMGKPDMLDDAVIEDLILPHVIGLKKLCDATFNYCLTRAKEGKKWRGFALSTTRPTRVYSDEKLARQIALKHGYRGFVTEGILSPAQAEKLMGKSAFKELLGSLVEYRQGKTTLVPEDEAKGAEAKNEFDK